MNNESIYQKNKTNEPEINISLVLTTQKTPNSETTKAFQSQFLSLSWASTRKHNSVSLTSLEVTKASPIAADVQFTTPKQKSKLSMVSLQTPKNESNYNSGPTTMHSPRMGTSSILVNIQKLTTSIKDEINTKLIRATTANSSATNTIISTLEPVTTPNISKGTKIPNELFPETSPENPRKDGITDSNQNITVIMPIISSADNFISTLLSTTSQVLPGQEKITQRLTDSSTFKRQTTNTKRDIHQTSYRREFITSPVYPITATSVTSTVTVSPVIPSTTDGIKKDQSTTSVLVATNMIENITSWLPLTSSITSNKDEIRNSITSISQSLNKDLETILTTMVQALSESTSERKSMPNKTNLNAKHEATLTHDTLTLAQQFVISPTSKKEMSTINLLVSTVKNETIATKPLTFSVTDELRKENTAALLTVTPDHNETNTTAAPNTLPAAFISNGSTKTITTSHAKITLSNKSSMLPVKSRTLITDVIKATFTAISSQSTSNKEEIRNEMNASLVPVKTGIGEATTTESYEAATQTTYSTTADIKNNHTGIPPLSSETMVRNKTSKAILPVTSSTILDKETITTETNSTSLPQATASNNSMLPVTLVISSITDRKTKKPTATSQPVIASMDNGNFAKVFVTASESSTSDRITDTKTSSLLSFTLPTSSSKIKSMKFTASQPKTSKNGITDEINFASQPDEEKNSLSTYGVNTKFPSATSPTISDTDELKASFTPVNLTLSQNHFGGGIATTVKPRISITMLCFALVCSFNDVTVVWNFDAIL